MKLAIFICGPRRYVNSVVNQIDLMPKKYDYGFFIHLWTDDIGNKQRRSNESEDLFKVTNKIALLIQEQPLEKEKVERDIARKSGTTSTNGAILGMFTSINMLYSAFKSHYSFNEYTHILRLRTDSFFLNKFALNIDLYDSAKMRLALNPKIPSHWISDHITLTTKEQFVKLWVHKSVKSLLKEYRNAGCNPERLLSKRMGRFCSREYLFKRDLDYFVKYDPALNSDFVAIYEEGFPYFNIEKEILHENFEVKLGLTLEPEKYRYFPKNIKDFLKYMARYGLGKKYFD